MVEKGLIPKVDCWSVVLPLARPELSSTRTSKLSGWLLPARVRLPLTLMLGRSLRPRCFGR